MRSALALFVLLMGLWLLSSGHYTAILIAFGLASSAGVVLLCSRMGIVDDEGVPVHLVGRALRYIPWITYQVFKANVDVARRILHPRMPISPRVIRVKAGQKSDIGRVIYANSITLTPGTVSIRVEGDEIEVDLKYGDRGEKVIQDLQRVSTPGCRNYSGVDGLGRIRDGLGIAVVSTSKGVLSDRQCREQRVGGEVLCTVW